MNAHDMAPVAWDAMVASALRTLFVSVEAGDKRGLVRFQMIKTNKIWNKMK